MAAGLNFRHPCLFIVFEEGHEEAEVSSPAFCRSNLQTWYIHVAKYCAAPSWHLLWRILYSLVLNHACLILFAHCCQNEDTNGASNPWVPILRIAVGKCWRWPPKQFPAPRSETPSSWKRRNSRSTQPGIKCFSVEQRPTTTTRRRCKGENCKKP